MVEFAFVVVLLIALLYGIICYGLVLAAQSTITQAAADGARAGHRCASTASAPPRTAEGQAATDVSWMGKGCYEPCSRGSRQPAITCVATPEQCPSNANNSCLSVTVTYNYAGSHSSPSFPASASSRRRAISSTNVLQMSTPSS